MTKIMKKDELKVGGKVASADATPNANQVVSIYPHFGASFIGSFEKSHVDFIGSFST